MAEITHPQPPLPRPANPPGAAPVPAIPIADQGGQRPVERTHPPAGPAASLAAEPLSSHSPPSRRRKLFFIFGIILSAIVIGGVIFYIHASHYEDTDDAFIDGDIVPISTKVSGIVETVYVNDNQRVAAGAAIVRIDPRDYQARLTQAQGGYDSAVARAESARTNIVMTRANTKATLMQAQAGIAEADAGVKTAEAQLASSEADVSSAEAEATRREADLKRFQSLDPRNVSQQQLDSARAASDAANAQLLAARKHVAAAEAMIIEAKARVAQAQGVLEAAQTGPQQVAAAEAESRNTEAAVAQAKAMLEQARIDLAYTSIIAPVGGRIARKSVEPGQYLQAGQSIGTIVRPDIWIIANFKETQLTHMHRGQDVEIRVDTYPGVTFHGKVDSIQAGSGSRFSMLPPENATGNYVKVVQRVPVKITFDQDPEVKRLLAPGMSAVPTVRITSEPNEEPSPISASPQTARLPSPATAPTTTESDTAILPITQPSP